MPPLKTTRTKAAPPAAPEEIESSHSEPIASTSKSTTTDDLEGEEEKDEQLGQVPREGGGEASGSIDRIAKMKQLRQRMVSLLSTSYALLCPTFTTVSLISYPSSDLRRIYQNESARLNRQDVISEMSAQRASVKALAKLERKKQQVESMGEKKRAEEEGEDLERKKNWEYSIEDSEKWEKKTARKERRSGFQFTSTCTLDFYLVRRSE